MTEKEKMLVGRLYDPADSQLVRMRLHARRMTSQFNQVPANDERMRGQILKSLFKVTGEKIYIESNFRCDYGVHITVGENFYANFDCVILDAAEVTIGNNCLIGPQVGIYTSTHPLTPKERSSGLELARPVTIGNNCWIGGHAILNPGVTLGHNVVVASGAVVTKNFRDNVVIAGNPARVINEIATNADL